MYQERTYRNSMKPKDLVNFTIIENETDLNISADSILKEETLKYVLKYRQDIMDYAAYDTNFYTSLVPIKVSKNAPDIVKHMAKAALNANVGPMAAVAGAISEYVGKKLLKYTDQIIIENGGDIFIKSSVDRKILIYAGNSPFTNNIAIKLPASNAPLGVCTSAGTVGHSLSFGKTDAVMVLSHDTLVADAAATSIGNIVVTPYDINKGIERAKLIDGIDGVLIIIEDKMGVWGNITLVKP